MSKEITVIFSITDEDAFILDRERILNSFKDYDPANPPANAVTAISYSNEMHRLELIEQAVEVEDADRARQCINHILSHGDISSLANLNDVLKDIKAR